MAIAGVDVLRSVGLEILQNGVVRAVGTAKHALLRAGVDDDVCVPGTYTSDWDYFTVGGNNTMKFGTGISLTYAYKENYAWRVFLDYDFSRKTYTLLY